MNDITPTLDLDRALEAVTQDIKNLKAINDKTFAFNCKILKEIFPNNQTPAAHHFRNFWNL